MKLSKYLEVTGMSQRDFARKVDRADSQVGRWLTGARRPDWPSLIRIKDATDGAVTPNDFLEMAE